MKTPFSTDVSGCSFNKELISVKFIFAQRDNVPCHLSPVFTATERGLFGLIGTLEAAIGAILLPLYIIGRFHMNFMWLGEQLASWGQESTFLTPKSNPSLLEMSSRKEYLGVLRTPCKSFIYKVFSFSEVLKRC